MPEGPCEEAKSLDVISYFRSHERTPEGPESLELVGFQTLHVSHLCRLVDHVLQDYFGFEGTFLGTK